jgi:hypothetical protein
MSDPTYIGVAADALREMAYIAAERAAELRDLSEGVTVGGTPANPNTILILDDEVPF